MTITPSISLLSLYNFIMLRNLFHRPGKLNHRIYGVKLLKINGRGSSSCFIRFWMRRSNSTNELTWVTGFPDQIRLIIWTNIDGSHSFTCHSLPISVALKLQVEIILKLQAVFFFKKKVYLFSKYRCLYVFRLQIMFPLLISVGFEITGHVCI